MKGKMYKVMTPVPKKDGGTWWMRLGSMYPAKEEGAFNLFLDAMPIKNAHLYIRELDEEDLVGKHGRKTDHANGLPLAPAPTPAQDGIPF